MNRTVAIIGALAAGGLVGLQPPANAALSQHVGDLGAALVSTVISVTIIAILLVTFGEPGRLAGLAHFRPAWAIGGIGGAAVVSVALASVRPLGAGAVVALLVAAQLFASVAADRFGWFGLHATALGPGRIAGLVLVIAGTALVVQR
jgi:transporter family-2 protein